MDVTIGEALSGAEAMLERIATGAEIPGFFASPLKRPLKGA
jgi:hypothetical protein